LKAPHLLRVEEEAACFAPLLAAARQAGLRAGWLDLETPVAAPPELAAAAELGALRAVAAAAGRSIAVKPLRGAPVLKDLLREHFLGCALVLVRAASLPSVPATATAPPRLRPAGGGWEVEPAGAAVRHFTTEELVSSLRRPRPWDACG
jgi:hypothetical protein